MNQLPQTQCPYCQAAIYWYSPGCFSCRQPITWPAPQTAEQASLQQASQAYFQQQLAQYQAAASQAQAAPSPQPAAAPSPQPPSRPSPATMETAGWDGAFEMTHHDSVRYDANAAEDVEGLDSGHYGDLIPKNLPTSIVEDYEATTARVESAGLGITGNEPGIIEATKFDGVQVQTAPLEDFDAANYSSVTASVSSAGGDPEVERTALDDAPLRPTSPARKAKKGDDGDIKAVCTACGSLSRGTRCGKCGAATKPPE